MSDDLERLLATEWPHPSPAPEVSLIAAFDIPFDGAVAAARTCYSPRGVITPDDVAPELAAADESEKRRHKRDRLARDLYQAGHHTVFQHAHFTFSLNNVSRQFAWSFLHSHPFYNSEQVSQRFVRVKEGTSLVPDLASQTEAYREALDFLYAAYKELREGLKPVVGEAFYGRFPARAKKPDAWKRAIAKRSQEIARYVLPVATFTYLHHTISGLTLMRYLRLADHPDTPAEQRYVMAQMVKVLLDNAPGYRAVLEAPLPTADQLAAEYAPPPTDVPPAGDGGMPERLGPDRFSELVSYQADAESLVRTALAEITGRPWSTAELERLLDPRANRMFGESLNLTYHDKLLRALIHVHYVFRKRLSHTADSQDQRHRMTPGSRPMLTAHLGGEPDIVYPLLIEQDDHWRRRYEDVMAGLWERIAKLRSAGVEPEWLQYLLPNGVAVRFTESTDFLALRHKHLMRLCYNAQEEIWRASVEEAEAVSQVHPRLGRWLLPPCSARERADTRPICPEGSRFCGIPVWKLKRADYERTI